MNLEKSLGSARQFMDEIDSKMNEISIPGEIRPKVFFGLLHLSLEHFGSIIILTEHKQYASAAALLRPQYEATMRALYFQECANENEISMLIQGKSPRTLRQMIDVLEKSKVSKSGTFSNFYQKNMKLMHAFTHGGLEQLERRYNSSDLTNNFKQNEILALIANAQVLACLAASCASIVSGNEGLALEFLQKYGEHKINNL